MTVTTASSIFLSWQIWGPFGPSVEEQVLKCIHTLVSYPCFFKVLKCMPWQLFLSWSVFNLERRKATGSWNVNSANIRNRMWTFRFTALCWVYTVFCLQPAVFLLLKKQLKFLLFWRKRMKCEVRCHQSYQSLITVALTCKMYCVNWRQKL